MVPFQSGEWPDPEELPSFRKRLRRPAAAVLYALLTCWTCLQQFLPPWNNGENQRVER